MAVEQQDNTRARPVNLNLMTIKFPVPAIASLLHRISGLLLVLFIPLLLFALEDSLNSAHSYMSIINHISSPFVKFIIWLFLTSFTYHLFAGIRHLIQDTGWGESLKAGRASAYIVMALTLVIAICTGIWLW